MRRLKFVVFSSLFLLANATVSNGQGRFPVGGVLRLLGIGRAAEEVAVLSTIGRTATYSTPTYAIRGASSLINSEFNASRYYSHNENLTGSHSSFDALNDYRSNQKNGLEKYMDGETALIYRNQLSSLNRYRKLSPEQARLDEYVTNNARRIEEESRVHFYRYPQWENYAGKTLKEFSKLRDAGAIEITRVIRAEATDPKKPIESFQRKYKLAVTGDLNETTIDFARFISDVGCVNSAFQNLSIAQLSSGNVSLISPKDEIVHLFRNGRNSGAIVRNPIFGGADNFIVGDGRFNREVNALTYWYSFDQAVSGKVSSTTEATFFYINGVPNENGSYGFTFGKVQGAIPASKLEQFIKSKRPIAELAFLTKTPKENIIVLRNAAVGFRNNVDLVIALSRSYGSQHSFYLASDFDLALRNLKKATSSAHPDYKVLAPSKEYKIKDYNVVRNLVAQGVPKEMFATVAPGNPREKSASFIAIGHKSKEYKRLLREGIDQVNTGFLLDISCFEKGYEDFQTSLLATTSISCILGFGAKIDAIAAGYVIPEFLTLRAAAGANGSTDFQLWVQAVDITIEKNKAGLDKSMLAQIRKLKQAIYQSVSFSNFSNNAVDETIMVLPISFASTIG